MATVTEGYKYITRIPGVRGGNAIVEGTRIGVHDVIGLLQNGETVDSILVTCFPDLTKRRFTSAWLTMRTIEARLTCWSPDKRRRPTHDLLA